jgi:hypothetical protein
MVSGNNLFPPPHPNPLPPRGEGRFRISSEWIGKFLNIFQEEGSFQLKIYTPSIHYILHIRYSILIYCIISSTSILTLNGPVVQVSSRAITFICIIDSLWTISRTISKRLTAEIVPTKLVLGSGIIPS